MDLAQRLASKDMIVGVIGLGYVGLPLAVGFGGAGLRVVGVDVDTARLESLRRGESYLMDVAGRDVAELVGDGRLTVTTDYDELVRADAIFICVPTPFTPTKVPDISYIVAVAKEVAKRLRRGQVIILQSTTHPGTTEEDVLPILATSGMRAGADFHLAFSPERINPGDRVHTVRNMPKVVGGLTPRCAELARIVLAHLTPQVFVVSSPRTAEMSKLLENTFRNVNIALVNELSLLCQRMGIDIWEVIAAAATKPFGFMPFFPGPGVGGHCIGVDPYYLSWKARAYDFYTKFIEIAAEVNDSMPFHVYQLVAAALNRRGKPVNGSKVLVLGVAFKRDIDDARNSPAQRIIELLLENRAQVSYNDPYVPRFEARSSAFGNGTKVLESVPLDAETLGGSDCVVIVAGHSVYDWHDIVARAPLVVDTVNATKGVEGCTEKVVRLGAPHA